MVQTSNPGYAIAIPGYTITELIHDNSHTAVYRGDSEEDHTPVIIKILQSEYPSPKEITRFKHEYEIAGKLNIRGVVKPLRLINYNNGLALILEDFGGESLKNISSAKNLEIIDFIAIAIRIAEVLGELHTHNIIHKDIKPQNIIYNSKKVQIKITDFSIASQLSKENPQLNNANSLEGTLAYISPEQTGRMNRPIDYRSDLYSLGATFYEILTHQLPFPTSDPLELIHCHIAKTPISPHEINPDIPEGISDVIMKLLSKNPEERYQSAYGLKLDLEECLMLLHDTGKISSFPLGKEDKSGQFHIPEKLYGREAEVAELLAAFERVSSGTSEIMLVGGYSGVGKSSLINEIHQPIIQARGYFVSGKFAQFNQHIPYDCLIKAFHKLIGQLLTENHSYIEQWKAKLLRVCGTDGQLIIEVIPELELILGEQPPVDQLDLNASQKRFTLVFKEFIKIFADVEHPLVIFLDDLQYADAESLNLIQSLITEPESKYLLILGAYRDHQVSADHPLMLMINEINAQGGKVNLIKLENLDLKDIKLLIAETLAEPTKKIAPIAELVLNKTQGNPFFINQLLESLYQEHLLNFNFRSGRWQWDIDELQTAAIADNVVELMVEKISQFPEAIQQLLQIAACIGNTFTLSPLALISEKSLKETAHEVWLLMEAGLIIPVSQDYKIGNGVEHLEGLEVNYKFLHERVRQAAYELIPEQQKQEFHLKIGQTLLQNTPVEELEQHIFQIVNQLNLGVELISNQLEKEQLAQLNLKAAYQAKSARTYETALNYLNLGIKILGQDGWKTQYELQLALHLEKITCEYLVGNFDIAEALVEIALKEAKSNYDQCAINNIRMIHYQNNGRYEYAIKVGLESLKLLGLELPYSPDQEAIISAALAVKGSLGERAIASLIDESKIEDREITTIINLLINLVLPAYLINQPLWQIAILKMTQICLKNGNNHLSAFVYASYGAVLCGNFNEYELGYQFRDLALNLVNKFPDSPINGRVYMLFGNLIKHWRKPVTSNLDIQEIAYQLAKEAGDFSWCHHSALFSFWQKFVTYQDLDSIPQEYKDYISFAQETEITAALTLIIQQNLVLNLKGLTNSQFSLSNEDLNESHFLETCNTKNYQYGLSNYYLAKLFLHFTYEDYQIAYEMVIAAEPIITSINSQFQLALYYFYKVLTILAIYSQANLQEQQQYWEIVQNHRSQLKLWADNCPENFAANFLLIEAEIARIEQKNWQAADLYDQAIESAKTNRLMQTEALANELAAKLYLQTGKTKVAKTYMRDAYYIYLKWGATAKLNSLESKYYQLLERLSTLDLSYSRNVTTTTSLTSTTSTTSTTTGSNSGVLDWSTVLKSSIALSGEIVLESLLQKLMKIALENAGAKNGFFLTKKHQQWVIEAEGAIDREEVTALQSIPIETSGLVPASIINYVERTQKNLVLDEACRVETFASDPYIVHNKPKSVLCSPIINQGKLTGMLYLENNETARAFTSDRLEILKVLTSQVSISIENALLYSNLQSYSEELEFKNQALQLSEQREREKAQTLEQYLHKLQQTQAQLVQTEKISTLGQLVAGVAHEVNNPISFIAGNLEHATGYIKDLQDLVELYQQHYPHPNPEITEFIEDIDLEYLLEDLPKMVSSMKVGTDRIREIMLSLRTFSRVDTPQKQSANIHQGIDSTLMILQHRLKAKAERPAIKLVKHYGELPLVECYAGQLNQVFMNLIANAIDALDEYNANRTYAEIEQNPNTITIRTELIGDDIDAKSVLIGIADNGPGMPEEVRQRLFDAFFTTKPAGKGTGLGLSISYQIVTEKHGGQLRCISTLGQGSEFIIEVPIK